MAASLTALATVIWSDFADAAEPAAIELADDVVVPQPVKLAKIEHKQAIEEETFEEILENPKTARPGKPSKRKSRLNFGSFEGY